jgi:NACalpha-BTF3-like transcription factor
MRTKTSLLLALGLSAFGPNAHAEPPGHAVYAQYDGSPAEQARKAREQETAKAAKKKADDDAIVARQREAEKAKAAKAKEEADRAAAAERAKQKK